MTITANKSCQNRSPHEWPSKLVLVQVGGSTSVCQGECVGIETFGVSASGSEVVTALGLTRATVLSAAHDALTNNPGLPGHTLRKEAWQPSAE